MVLTMDGWTLAANLSTLLATVLAFAGLWLAWQTAREQRHNRDFPSDKAYADDFDQKAARLSDEARRGYERKSVADALNAAVAAYGPAHRSDRRGEIRTMMSRHTQRAEAILRAEPQAPLTFEQSSEVQQLIDQARRIAEDWAYPERRRDTMAQEYRTLYRDTTAAGTVFDYPEDIQVRRWLLTGLPADIRIAQAARVARVWIDRLLYDIRQRRVMARLRAWRLERRVRRQEMAAYQASLAPAPTPEPADQPVRVTDASLRPAPLPERK
ncbi:hypothetical protein CH252_32970 [Rhodococcus sp. 06-1477-1B]|nr:hypothetical protein CH252_32970 [Rhodococcus sp. 06-1477-1B]